MSLAILAAAALLPATLALAAESRHQVLLVLSRSIDRSGLAALGATVDADLNDALVVSVDDAKVELLRSYPGVRYVQQVALPDGSSPTPRPEPLQAATLSEHRAQTDAAWSSGTYAYDAAGNIRSIGTNTYWYDGSSRLVHAGVSGHVQSFTYDGFGNLKQIDTDSEHNQFSVSAATNRISSPTVYDIAGSVTADAMGYSYVYDAFGMVQNKRNGVEADVYDVADERVGALRGGQWYWTVRDEGGHVLREYRSSDTTPSAMALWLGDYVWRDGSMVASQRMVEEGGTRHYHLDHLGSVRLVTGTGGAKIAAHDYYPFGREITPINPDTAAGMREDQFRFTGHERDWSSGTVTDKTDYLDYMHARYYNPNAGRFLSIDPAMDLKKTIPNPQKWNRYSYVRNNPINAIDPDGKDDLFIGDDFTEPFAAARGSKATIDNGTASALISFIPGYGDAYDAISAIRGRDLLTGDRIGTFARIAGVMLPFIGVGGLNKASEIFRGGSNMVAAAKDVKIIDGLVQTTHGVSLNKVASEVGHFEGGAYRVTSIPDGLQIIQRGTKNANHLEIVPKKPISMEDYQKLLDQVKLEKVQ